MERKTNRANLEIFKFLRKSANRKAIAFDEISEIVPSMEIHNRNSFIFVSCFEIFTETLEQIVTKSHKILFLDGKEDK